MPSPTSGNFKWKSWLGVSVILFLLYGAFNVLAAIGVPSSLHGHGAGAMGGLIVSTNADTKVLGQPLMTLFTSNPKLSDYLVAFMDTMCMMMMAFGLLQLAVAWYGLRTGQSWALWAL